jgi:hypothetical protein
MSTNKNLFKEAIADAKSVREAALKNAKIALEEALTPQLQSMLSKKLQEMEHDEDELKETFATSHEESDGVNLDFNLEENDLEEDFDLSEILAELEADEMEEAKKKKVMGSKAAEKEAEETYGEKEEPYMAEAEKEGEEEEEEEKEVKDMSVEELKDLIKGIIDQELEAEEEETPADEEHEKEHEMGHEEGEEEINLDELLAELEEEMENEELEEVMIPIKKINSKFSGALKGLKGYTTAKGEKSNFDKAGAKNGVQKQLKEEEEMEEGVSDFVKKAASLSADQLAKLKKYYDTEISPKSVKPGGKYAEKGYTKLPSNLNETEKEEMEEAISTINTLRNELNEVNLLNAKLLYVNKIFKSKNLTESQKLKVIASFDKATNVKEAKMVFESLNNAISTPAKKAIKESLGFASKAAGIAPNRTIVESNDVISRMQKLANIIK